MENSKYIEDPEACRQTAEEFLQEFKDLVYPAYASFGFTLPEALIVWKLNVVGNQLSNLLDNDDNDWKET